MGSKIEANDQIWPFETVLHKAFWARSLTPSTPSTARRFFVVDSDRFPQLKKERFALPLCLFTVHPLLIPVQPILMYTPPLRNTDFPNLMIFHQIKRSFCSFTKQRL